MPTGKLETYKIKTRDVGTIKACRADARLAGELPALALPTMPEAVRVAFRAVIDHERPCSNGTMHDCLVLAQARGFSIHPSDWLPFTDRVGAGGHPPLYQPWIDWLSDNGLTEYHEANTLTEENWSCWKPQPRGSVWGWMVIRDTDRALELLKRVAPSQSASVREGLLREVYARGSFDGNYPGQVPVLQFFLEDRIARIGDLAREKLEAMQGFETTRAHAVVLANYLRVERGAVTVNKDVPEPARLYQHWRCATIDEVAAELGLAARDLALMADLEALGSMFDLLVCMTGDVPTRTAFADRQLAGPPEGLSLALFRGLDRALWERALTLLLRSNYWNSVQEHLGPEMGTLSVEQMHQMQCYEALERSAGRSEKPVNSSYDPLRVIAFSVNADAAEVALERALLQGVKANDPRLTMLKFNLALGSA